MRRESDGIGGRVDTADGAGHVLAAGGDCRDCCRTWSSLTVSDTCAPASSLSSVVATPSAVIVAIGSTV